MNSQLTSDCSSVQPGSEPNCGLQPDLPAKRPAFRGQATTCGYLIQMDYRETNQPSAADDITHSSSVEDEAVSRVPLRGRVGRRIHAGAGSIVLGVVVW